MIIFGSYSNKSKEGLKVSLEEREAIEDMTRDQMEESGWSKEEIDEWMEVHQEMFE